MKRRIVRALLITGAGLAAWACAAPRREPTATPAASPASPPPSALAANGAPAPRAAVEASASKRATLPPGCGPSGASFACNPLTNAGCEVSRGEACDDDEHGGFKCYPAPNEVKLGGDCNIVEGPSCAAGLGCNGVSASDPDGECGRFCCAAGDCPSGEKCVPIDSKFGALGFCE